MLNMHSKFPGAAAAATGDHTQRTLGVAMVAIQVLLVANRHAGHCPGAGTAAVCHNHLTTWPLEGFPWC